MQQVQPTQTKEPPKDSNILSYISYMELQAFRSLSV